MTLKLKAKTITVHPERTFTIARSSADAFERVILEIEDGGQVSRGEAAPTGRYDQDAGSVRAALEAVTVEDPWDIEGSLNANATLPPSALAALDAALHDLAAKSLGVPVYRLLGFARPAPVTAYTLGIADRETTLRSAREYSGLPIFKMKVGGYEDVETVRAVAEVSGAEIWVDANEAFTPEDAPEVARELKEIGVAMIEQPVPAAAGPEALRRWTEAARPTPVISDESSISARDVPALSGCVSGVNVKLAKCGGIRRALELIHTARALGMMVMLGCMVETSLGIAAAAQVSGLVDFVDLDGPLLLADDPYSGVGFEKGRILLSEEPGLGVEPR
ncbi:MAG: dipeptide epimerase [Actinomycetota bacterium]|nr:dipeptide epimerase [Actinomycetota bacterium]